MTTPRILIKLGTQNRILANGLIRDLIKDRAWNDCYTQILIPIDTVLDPIRLQVLSSLSSL